MNNKPSTLHAKKSALKLHLSPFFARRSVSRQPQQPDVVLCDIGLPDMDGCEVARTLRTNGALARTRLVALSGYAQAKDLQRARDAGFDAHLAKPPLLSKLNDLLAGDG